jgi:metal-responsive CopG/Arc/MetJ family transcriptional regulator
MTKINISINDELAKRIDDYCERNYTNRSALFAQSANQFLLAQSIPQALGEMAVAFKRIADNNEIDEESKKTLNEFMYLAKLLGGTK